MERSQFLFRWTFFCWCFLLSLSSSTFYQPADEGYNSFDEYNLYFVPKLSIYPRTAITLSLPPPRSIPPSHTIGYRLAASTRQHRRLVQHNRVSALPTRADIVLRLILAAGDIESNPGPAKHPCSACSHPVHNNQKGIQCDVCHLWCHTK